MELLTIGNDSISDRCFIDAPQAVGVLSVGNTLSWLAAALLGNIVGGVGIVAILNYGQVRAGDPNESGA